jgi:hypothetical protein
VRLVMSQNMHLLVNLRLDYIPTLLFACLLLNIFILLLYIFLLQSTLRPESSEEDPNEHGGLHNIYIQLPLIQDLMSTKIQQLPVHQRSKFLAKLFAYDSKVGKIVATIKQCLNKIGRKQYHLADTIGELINEVLRAEIYSSDIEDHMTQPCNASVLCQLSFSSYMYTSCKHMID